MLAVEHLRVSYGPTEVLRDVSFTVPRATIVALLGGNGSGKSTTLNVLSGLVPAAAGRVMLDGARVDGLPAADLVRRGIVQVPQGREVWAGMSVADNLVLGATTRRDRQGIEVDRRRVFDLFPVLRERQWLRAGALSGGEQQMLAIGRALMARPQLLLMDEPSAGLAPLVVETMIGAIRRLHATGLTILLVEQNVGVAAALADRAHILMNGAIAHSAPAAGLFDDPEVLRSYLGR
jgi:branched-chain amino acid transport system ATP-binding protein